MIVITVKVWPGGDETRARHLGTAYIANDNTGDQAVGNYDVRLSKWGRPRQTWKKGRVEKFRRKTRGPWDLLYLALRNIVGGRNGG